jgi:quercetin dioxygenase-like cupin family protein
MTGDEAIRFERVTAEAAQPLEGKRRGYFEGDVRIQAVSGDPGPDGTEFLAVFFSPGGRTRPHVHPVEQTLHVVEGEGVVAVEGRRWRIRAGDVVVVPAGLWHWHGATPDTPMCHVSVKQPGETDWHQPEKDFGDYMGDL